jgi:mRNA-degrading endonuclease RelE of RelBE toxin-antitoxin system
MPNSPAFRVSFTPEFKRSLRLLAKRYRHIKSDLTPLLDELSFGQLPGNIIQGCGVEVYKVSLKNSDISKGKSAGYRVVYLLKKSRVEIVLLAIYSKSDQGSISAAQIRRIMTPPGL